MSKHKAWFTITVLCPTGFNSIEEWSEAHDKGDAEPPTTACDEIDRVGRCIGGAYVFPSYESSGVLDVITIEEALKCQGEVLQRIHRFFPDFKDPEHSYVWVNVRISGEEDGVEYDLSADGEYLICGDKQIPTSEVQFILCPE